MRSPSKEQTINVNGKKNKTILKAIIFLVFVVAAITMVRFTPVRNYLTVEMLSEFLKNAGLWAPVAYIALNAIGVCLFLPGTLLTGLGAAILGPYWGFVYVWIAAMIGSSAAFLSAERWQENSQHLS
jgi:uncharacterized membrane protein YdjX (TVP38/TMEM64 family)